MKNPPKSRPTMFLLDLLYKTVLWCFLFDFMLISNGTGHSFIVFLYIKEEINFSEYFWKTCKKPLFKQNFGLIKVNFRRLWLKNCPNGEISPNLVTLTLGASHQQDKIFVISVHRQGEGVVGCSLESWLKRERWFFFAEKFIIKYFCFWVLNFNWSALLASHWSEKS